jgi:plastocyanin
LNLKEAPPKKGIFMTRSLLVTVLLVTAVATTAVAGTIEGKVSPGKSVVYVDTIQGKTFPAPTQKPVMDQKGLVFSPHIMVVQQGTTVEFLNSDTVQHNVFWPSISGNKKLTHNLGTWPKGEKKAFKFDNPGVVSLLCNVHPEMSGYIVVSPTPYFAETDASGNYKIENVPDGKYNVVAWHEGTKQQSKSVDVAGTGKADFTLSK